MRTFWKALSIAIFATCFVSFLISFSMYWWPNIPSSPRPDQGRIYALNDHGHYTYMSRQEYVLQRFPFWLYLFCIPALAAIQHFVDPFGEKQRPRPLRPPRPW